MPQWEYNKVYLNELPRRKDDIDVLNELGVEGWELLGVTSGNIAYLKRPIPIPASAPKRAGGAARASGS